MKTDFKVLVENAKLQVSNTEVITEDIDVFDKLEDTINTINLLESNGLDSLDVQYIEVALVEQVMLEFKLKNPFKKKEVIPPKKEGLGAKIMKVIKELLTSIWNFITMNNGNIVKRIEKLHMQSNEALKRKDWNPFMKKGVAEFNIATRAALRHAKRWDTKILPKYKGMYEKAKVDTDNKANDPVKAAKAMKQITKLRIKSRDIIATFKNIEKNMKIGLKCTKDAVKLDSITKHLSADIEHVKKLTGSLENYIMLSIKLLMAAIPGFSIGIVAANTFNKVI